LAALRLGFLPPSLSQEAGRSLKIFPMRKLIFFDQIDIQNSPVVRANLRTAVVEEYAVIYAGKRDLMPVPHVFAEEKGKTYLLADGRHRIEAAKKANLKALECEVHHGNYSDAVKFALGANVAHGLQRSHEDKRQGVLTALQEFPKLSNAQLAGLCFVDDHTVAKIRERLEASKTIAVASTRIGADGRETNAQHAKKNEPVSVAVLDETGYEIPKGCLKFWERKKEVQEILSQIARIKKFIKGKLDQGDLMYAELSNATLADADKFHYSVSVAMPYAVCPTCQGHPELQPDKNCRNCMGRGLISKFRWHAVPEQIRKLREKG